MGGVLLEGRFFVAATVIMSKTRIRKPPSLSTMEHQQATIVEKYQESKLKSVDGVSDSDDDNLLEILESLDNDEDEVFHLLREQRLEQLKKEFNKIDKAVGNLGSDVGHVQFSDDEKEVMDVVTKCDIALVHFYQPTFPKCKIMNDTLGMLAEKHVSLRILAMQAEKAPFLVSKLAVKVLPFVVIYKNGRELLRLVGFDGIAASADRVSLDLLERKLLDCGAINRQTINFKSIRGKAVREEESDDEWE